MTKPYWVLYPYSSASHANRVFDTLTKREVDTFRGTEKLGIRIELTEEEALAVKLSIPQSILYVARDKIRSE